MASQKWFAIIWTTCLFIARDSEGLRLYERSAKPSTFEIYWQVPTESCRAHGVDFSDVAKEGIVQNTGDKFKGDKIIIMYDPGRFPILKGSQSVDGGLPQKGDLKRHLDIFEQNVTQYIPDKNFNGLAVIDFEHWRPIFRENWASLDVYRTKSKELVKSEYPHWTDKEIYNEAERRWEEASFRFFKDTLDKARTLRENAKWGYYGFPYCFNYSPMNQVMECTKDVKVDNDRSAWMWKSGNALYPSVYFSENDMNEKMRANLIQGRVEEGVRIASKAQIPLYIYTWFKYRDTLNFVSEMDMLNNLDVPKRYGANGVIIWGSSKDVDTKEKCEDLFNYFKNVITPAVKKNQQT